MHYSSCRCRWVYIVYERTVYFEKIKAKGQYNSTLLLGDLPSTRARELYIDRGIPVDRIDIHRSILAQFSFSLLRITYVSTQYTRTVVCSSRVVFAHRGPAMECYRCYLG